MNYKKRRIFISLFLTVSLIFTFLLNADEVSLKQEARELFESGDRKKAISLLEKAVDKNPDDAEIHYLLGQYTHYVYSMPLPTFNEEQSDKVLEYLNKAVELDPDYGDAYFFIGSEHGDRFLNAVRKGDLEKGVKEFQMGYKKGGYTEWMLEFADNVLNSCDSNAILFTYGGPPTWPIWYLQFAEDYRKDVTVITCGLTPLPWLMLKYKIGKPFGSVPISWSDEKINAMEPCVFDSSIIRIQISDEMIKKYNISPKDSVVIAKTEPDIVRDSISYISGGKALILDIIRNNQWERPVYFTMGIPQNYYVGLQDYLQLQGIIYKLLPVNVKEHHLSIDFKKAEKILLNTESFEYFSDIKEHYIPFASNMPLHYHICTYRLANYYFEEEKYKKAKVVLEKMKIYLPEDVFPIPKGLKEAINKLYEGIKEKEK